jgi:DivIVA domain-containing protein
MARRHEDHDFDGAEGSGEPVVPVEFTMALRGYDRFQVDDHLRRLRQGSSPDLGGRFRGLPEFDVVLRGYDQREVDDYLGREPDGARLEGRSRPAPVRFKVRWRGYRRFQVDEYIRRLQRATADAGSPRQEPRTGPPRFDVALRGYDRHAVADYLRQFPR